MTYGNVLYLSATLVAAVAAFTDWKRGLIPNRLTGSALVAGVLIHVVAFSLGHPQVSPALWLVQSLAGVLLCGLVPFMMWKKDAMGGGDLKLLAALGGLLGPVVGLEVELYAFISALTIAPIKLVYEGQFTRVAVNALRVAANPFLPREKQFVINPALSYEVRFGPFVLLGVMLAAALRWNYGT